jgi:hypothetical protein
MRLPIARIIVLAIAVEALAIAILGALVAIFGPYDYDAVFAYAEHLGQFEGPISAAVLCFAAAWWLAKRARPREILSGFLVGVVCSAVDLALLVPLGGKFSWLIAVSNAGRLVAGTLGGWVGRARKY